MKVFLNDATEFDEIHLNFSWPTICKIYFANTVIAFSFLMICKCLFTLIFFILVWNVIYLISRKQEIVLQKIVQQKCCFISCQLQRILYFRMLNRQHFSIFHKINESWKFNLISQLNCFLIYFVCLSERPTFNVAFKCEDKRNI